MADVWKAVTRRAAGFWFAYVIVIGGVLVATASSMSRNRLLLAAGFVLLALAASRFREVVRRDGGGGRRRRVVVAVVQFVVGAVVTTLALTVTFWGADAAFLLGATLAILAAGGLVSELRTVRGPLVIKPWIVVFGGGVITLLAAVVFDGWRFMAVAVVILVAGSVLYDLGNRSDQRWWGRPGVVLLAAAVAFLAVGAAVEESWFVGFVLAGLVAGELGTELLSEDSHDESWDGRPRRLVLPLGVALLLVASVALLVWADVQPSHLPFLLLGLGIVAWMAASDSDSLLLVGLVVLALVWTAAPSDPRPGNERQVHDVEAGDDYFLVLGDSYISGEGAKRFLPGTNTTEEDDVDHVNECRRAPTAWPLRLARYRSRSLEDVVPDRALFLACSGAVAANLDTEPRMVHGRQAGPAELALFRRAKQAGLEEPEFVLVQVGGNNARFGDIGPACVGPGSCAELGQQFLNDLARIGADLDAAYRRIQDEVAEGVPIIAIPYPIPLSATNACDDVLLRGDEHVFVANFVQQLNEMVESAADRNGLFYMEPMEGALRDSGTMLCDEAGLGAGINFLAFSPKEGALGQRLNPTNWTHNSLHPNAAGHEALHDAAVGWFQTTDLTEIPEPDPGRHRVADLDSFFDGRHIRQCAPAGADACDTENYAWHLRQLHDQYLVLLPIGLAILGAWLVLAKPIWGARKRGVSLAKVVRATLRPEPPGPSDARDEP
jgi:hypothetical protein